jgi:hypothetical protein
MKTSGVRKGVLVYKGPDPVGKMEIPVKLTEPDARTRVSRIASPANQRRIGVCADVVVVV